MQRKETSLDNDKYTTLQTQSHRIQVKLTFTSLTTRNAADFLVMSQAENLLEQILFLYEF